jgi:hypothetical protein
MVRAQNRDWENQTVLEDVTTEKDVTFRRSNEGEGGEGRGNEECCPSIASRRVSCFEDATVTWLSSYVENRTLWAH